MMYFDDPPLLDPQLEFKNWRTLKFACFDIETTDFPFIRPDGKKDGEAFNRLTGKAYEVNPDFSIVQFYGLMYEFDEIVDKIDLLINPGMPIPPDSTKIHGITDDMVVDCPTVDEVMEEIVEFLLAADFIAAFNGRFDQNCIEIECRRLGLPVVHMNCLDLLVWERESRGSFSRNKLSDVAKRHGVAKMAHVAHKVEALHDARTDVHVYGDLIREYAPKLPMTLGQLMKRQHQAQKKHDTYLSNKYNKPKEESE